MRERASHPLQRHNINFATQKKWPEVHDGCSSSEHRDGSASASQLVSTVPAPSGRFGQDEMRDVVNNYTSAGDFQTVVPVSNGAFHFNGWREPSLDSSSVPPEVSSNVSTNVNLQRDLLTT